VSAGGTSKVLVAVTGVALLGGVGAEELARRAAERRYRQAQEGRQQLELQFGEVLATHEQVKTNLQREQQRSQELTQALGTMRSRLEEAVGRLTEETRQVRELQTRLTAMQQQMDSLQSELAVALQIDWPKPAAEQAEPVELQRIVVSDAGAAELNGRVLSVHEQWNFIVIDLGWDAVKIGDLVSIFRDEQLLAKARVERVQEGVAAATVLPEWKAVEIHVNDLVKLLSVR